MKNLLMILTLGLIFSCNSGHLHEDDKIRSHSVVEIGGTPQEPIPQKAFPTPKEVVKDSKPILLYTVTGEWKLGQTDGTWADEYCVFEIFYTKSTHSYELKTSGYQPKNHSEYENVSKLMIGINNDLLNGLNFNKIRNRHIELQ